jgi:hypothetical protein
MRKKNLLSEPRLFELDRFGCELFFCKTEAADSAKVAPWIFGL